MTFKFQILKVMLERPETLLHASTMLEIIGEEKANAMATHAQQLAMDNCIVTKCKAPLLIQKALFSLFTFGEGDKKISRKLQKARIVQFITFSTMIHLKDSIKTTETALLDVLIYYH